MKTLITLSAAAAVLTLNACVATSPNWDSRFGEAARSAAAQQVIYPDASDKPQRATGVDGKAAEGAMGSYAKSYAPKEQPAPSLTVNVGGAK